MQSKFGLQSIGKDFPKTFTSNMKGKTMIKWVVLPTKNQNNQYDLIYEYKENEE